MQLFSVTLHVAHTHTCVCGSNLSLFVISQGDDVKALLRDATPQDMDTPPSSVQTTKAAVANKGLTVAGVAFKGLKNTVGLKLKV